MQTFLISISNFFSTAYQFIHDTFVGFHSLLEAVKDNISFIMRSLAQMPGIVRTPATIILGFMIVKFLLSFGKQ